MDTKEIQDLLKLINKSTLTDVEIEKNDFKLRVQRRSPENVTYHMGAATPQVVPAQVPVIPQVAVAATPSAETAAPAAPAAPAKEAKEEAQSDNLVEFPSPIIGTFYRSASPDKDAFVKVGDTISKGQILCIVEAMKLFNEIEAEHDGKIVKVLAENAQPVEYGQPLFLIDVS